MIYPAVAGLLRELLPRARRDAPQTLERYRLTLVSVWPDALRYLPASEELETWLAISREGNLPSWTVRLAHGLTDFLNAYAASVSDPPLTITFTQSADSLDREFFAIFERRADRSRIVWSFTEPVAQEKTDEPATPEALLVESRRCMHRGYYAAALPLAQRGRAGLRAGELYSSLTRNVLFSLLLLGRFDEVDRLCEETLANGTDPALLAHTAYARAILMVRLYEPARRDISGARLWVERALAYTEQVPPSETRSVNLAFFRNTLALVEMRMGNLQSAHDLLNSGLELIAAEAPARYPAECVLLLHNRARLHSLAKNSAGAMADLSTLLENQPQNSEAYLDRGLLHQRAGHYEAALADYVAAIRWSPPFPEVYFNRAQTLAALERREEALADYDYVLSLLPDHVEALNNRGCLLFESGRIELAAKDAERGLELNPRHARLLCLHGLVLMKCGEFARARARFTESLDADPRIADAWANRGVARAHAGDWDGAVEDLMRALEIREDPGIRENLERAAELQRVPVEKCIFITCKQPLDSER